VIVVVAALKGGVGKTTTAVYLAAAAAGGKRSITLVDSDPQASAADWVEHGADEVFETMDVVEAPTERLLAKVLDLLLVLRVAGEALGLVGHAPALRALREARELAHHRSHVVSLGGGVRARSVPGAGER